MHDSCSSKHKLAVVDIQERLVAGVIEILIIVKMDEQMTFSGKNLLKVTLTCEMLLKAGQTSQ